MAVWVSASAVGMNSPTRPGYCSVARTMMALSPSACTKAVVPPLPVATVSAPVVPFTPIFCAPVGAQLPLRSTSYSSYRAALAATPWDAACAAWVSVTLATSMLSPFAGKGCSPYTAPAQRSDRPGGLVPELVLGTGEWVEATPELTVVIS
jgi:hypothetical protein